MMGNIYHEWNGTTLIITSDSGTSACDLKGQQGDIGIRGPVGSPGAVGPAGTADLTIERGEGPGSVVIKPYIETDEDGTQETVSVIGATGQGALALAKGADARGKRSKVLGKNGIATEKAWDSLVLGQVCESDASGNLVGGIRTINRGNYGITFGTDCITEGNVRALNIGISNTMYPNTEDDYGFRFAIGTGLSIGNVKYKSALGQYNVGYSDAIFEYGNGEIGKRKNVFDITTTNAIRQYGNKWFINQTENGNGRVRLLTDNIPTGAEIDLEFPTESGKLAIEKNTVAKVNTPMTLYATNNKGEFESTLKYSYDPIQYTIPRRYTNGNIIVPVTPGANDHAASKGYVDTKLNDYVKQTSSAYKIYGVDANGEQKNINWAFNSTTRGDIVVRDDGGNIIIDRTPEQITSDIYAVNKKYVDEKLNECVKYQTSASKVYGVNAFGKQALIPWAYDSNTRGDIVVRDFNGNIIVNCPPELITDNNYVVNKKYVDTKIAEVEIQADKVSNYLPARTIKTGYDLSNAKLIMNTAATPEDWGNNMGYWLESSGGYKIEVLWQGYFIQLIKPNGDPERWSQCDSGLDSNLNEYYSNFEWLVTEVTLPADFGTVTNISFKDSLDKAFTAQQDTVTKIFELEA